MPPPLKEGPEADKSDQAGCARAYQRALKNKDRPKHERRPKSENDRLLRALAEALDVYSKDLIRGANGGSSRSRRVGTAA